MSRQVYLRAWLLVEGDVLAGGERVVLMQRDPSSGRVEIATDDGRRRVLYREDQLVAVCCLTVDVKTRCAEIGAFLGGARRRRQ